VGAVKEKRPDAWGHRCGIYTLGTAKSPFGREPHRRTL